jgi:hypothetical protein
LDARPHGSEAICTRARGSFNVAPVVVAAMIERAAVAFATTGRDEGDIVLFSPPTDFSIW